MGILMLMLAADEGVDIVFGNDFAFLPIKRTLLVGFYWSVAEWLDDIDDMSRWLHAWAESPDRQPDLRPDWARRRKIDHCEVRAVANAIASTIATSAAHDLYIESTAGQCATLAIPARARLRPPQPQKTRSWLGQVTDVVIHQIGTTPTGQTVYVSQRAVQTIARGSDLVEVRVPAPRTAKAILARQLQPLDGGTGGS
jgi:hypothetical protein